MFPALVSPRLSALVNIPSDSPVFPYYKLPQNVFMSWDMKSSMQHVRVPLYPSTALLGNGSVLSHRWQP